MTACKHVWKTYTGLKETFEYCEKCDQKNDRKKSQYNETVLPGSGYEVVLPFGQGSIIMPIASTEEECDDLDMIDNFISSDLCDTVDKDDDYITSDKFFGSKGW